MTLKTWFHGLSPALGILCPTALHGTPCAYCATATALPPAAPATAFDAATGRITFAMTPPLPGGR